MCLRTAILPNAIQPDLAPPDSLFDINPLERRDTVPYRDPNGTPWAAGI